MDIRGKRQKLQIIVATLLLVIIIFGELYTMLCIKDNVMWLVFLVILELIVVYMLVSNVMAVLAEKDARKEEQYDSIFKSEKASYLMLRKYFEEIEEKLDIIEESSKIPTEEIINCQKAATKLMVNRSKENTDAIINSNDYIIEKIEGFEKDRDAKIDEAVKECVNGIASTKSQVEIQIQDVILQMKDMEIRLNQAISENTKVVMPAISNVSLPSEEKAMVKEMDIEPEIEAEVEAEPEPEPEPVAEPELEPELEPVAEPEPAPDMSDPNKTMSPDEIAALFANMAGETVEEQKDEEVVVEEEEPAPDMSDPNKTMSPDEIAALFANMAGESTS